MSNKITISFVVDKLALHYYQAELLLYSLTNFANYKKSDILVQCVDRVENYFIKYLQDNNFNYIIIKPFLDGKYCNKIRQLEYFEDKNIEGVILIDTDTFILGKLDKLSGNVIMAKVVDAPNPPIHVLKNIYTAASLEIPKIIHSDWNIPCNETMDNNFNGGLYYIPKRHIKIISAEWKRWSTWLYDKEYLFDKSAQFIHVDQIGFSLALKYTNLEYKHLPANYNFPIHQNHSLNSYQKEHNIKIIHYHREINEFGLINSSKFHQNMIEQVIDKANDFILEKKKIIFLSKYKKSLIKNLDYSLAINEFESKLKKLVDHQKKLNLILHAGTPKTGTTSLQFFMDDNFKLLLKNGYLYPKEYINTPAPKHQWITALLMENNLNELFNYIQRIYNKANTHNAHTIILSTEGIYNHWFDYDSQAKATLQIISKYFNTTILTYFREPISFLDSLYRQYTKNPQIPLVKCYGKDLSFKEMSNDKWFIKHIDYLGFIQECESIFGKENVRVLKYTNDIIKNILGYLDIKYNPPKNKNKNIKLGYISIEILKLINRYNFNLEDKSTVISNLSQLDTILTKYSTKTIISDIEASNIKKKFSLQAKILEDEYNLCF